MLVWAVGLARIPNLCLKSALPKPHNLRGGPLRCLVVGTSGIDIELDYLPHVIKCENGAASYEALKAQAVAARSYLYYKIFSSGHIADGQSDQVYSCGRDPSAIHYEAAADTAGIYLSYEDTLLAAFYVAGAHPSDTLSCIATDQDPEDFTTEHYVTYNWGLYGDDVTQTTLGWVSDTNLANRGCMSQNGSDCLSNAGWGYEDILRFYYGMDINFAVADGDCLEDVPCEDDPDCLEEDAETDDAGDEAPTGPADSGAEHTDLPALPEPNPDDGTPPPEPDSEGSGFDEETVPFATQTKQPEAPLPPVVVSSCGSSQADLAGFGLLGLFLLRRRRAARRA